MLFCFKAGKTERASISDSFPDPVVSFDLQEHTAPVFARRVTVQAVPVLAKNSTAFRPSQFRSKLTESNFDPLSKSSVSRAPSKVQSAKNGIATRTAFRFGQDHCEAFNETQKQLRHNAWTLLAAFKIHQKHKTTKGGRTPQTSMWLNWEGRLAVPPLEVEIPYWPTV